MIITAVNVFLVPLFLCKDLQCAVSSLYRLFRVQMWHLTWWTHNAFVQWNAICTSNVFIIPKIFISYYFYIISNRKSCGNGLISLRVNMSHLCFRNMQCTKVLCPELFPIFGIYFLLAVGEFICWYSYQVVWYFVVITGTVNDVNSSSVIYRTSSNVSFVSPVKLWKLDMSPLCSKHSICVLIL